MARNGCAVKAISVTRHPVSSAFPDRRPGNAGCSERACLVTQSGRAVDRHAAGASVRSVARFQPSGSVRTRRIGLLARPKMATWSDCVWGCPQLLLANPLAKLAVAHLPRELHRDRRNYLAVSRPGQPERRARPARLQYHRGRKPIPRVGGLDQLRFCRRNPADLRSLIASGDDTKHQHVTDGKVLYDRQSARRVEHDRTGRAVAQQVPHTAVGEAAVVTCGPRDAQPVTPAPTAPNGTQPASTGRARADRAARHGRDTAAPQPGRQPGPGAGAPGAARASQGRWLRDCGCPGLDRARLLLRGVTAAGGLIALASPRQTARVFFRVGASVLSCLMLQRCWLIHTDTWAGSRAWSTTVARSSRTECRSTVSFRRAAKAATVWSAS
jgi:hypothetical protein